MKTIALACQKGGVGKSTLAVNLAAAFVGSGRAAALIDMDGQGSTFHWSERRLVAMGVETPFAVTCLGVGLKSQLAKFAKAGCDVTIIDTRGTGDSDAATAMAASDLIIVPVTPSFADVEAIGLTLDMIDRSRKPGMVVLNKVQHFGEHAAKARELVKAAGGLVPPIQIGQRIAFVSAFTEGRSIYEREPRDARAIAEMSALFDLVNVFLFGEKEAAA